MISVTVWYVVSLRPLTVYLYKLLTFHCFNIFLHLSHSAVSMLIIFLSHFTSVISSISSLLNIFSDFIYQSVSNLFLNCLHSIHHSSMFLQTSQLSWCFLILIIFLCCILNSVSSNSHTQSLLLLCSFTLFNSSHWVTSDLLNNQQFLTSIFLAHHLLFKQ